MSLYDDFCLSVAEVVEQKFIDKPHQVASNQRNNSETYPDKLCREMHITVILGENLREGTPK